MSSSVQESVSHRVVIVLFPRPPTATNPEAALTRVEVGDTLELASELSRAVRRHPGKQRRLSDAVEVGADDGRIGRQLQGFRAWEGPGRDVK